MYMGTLGINIHFHSINCPTLTHFQCKIWMSINRVTIYIFGILRHPRSIIHIRFYGGVCIGLKFSLRLVWLFFRVPIAEGDVVEGQRPLRLHRRGAAAGEPGGQDGARHRPRRQPHGVPGTAGMTCILMTFSQQSCLDLV